MTEKNKTVDPIKDLLKIKNYDPADPNQATAVSAALQLLSFCSDTMAILLERTNARPRNQHNTTYDALSGNDPAD